MTTENKIKIVIAGMGGVGGYFGGLLARQYHNSPTVEIIFLARNQHLQQIQNKGLQVIHGEDTFTARPALATDDAAAIGKANYILLCTKSYDLEATIEQLKPCIDAHTIILPLLNGVDSTERIKAILPQALVAQGCVYIVSRLKEAGVIENTGNIQTLYLGSGTIPQQQLATLHQLMLDAHIGATLSQEIETILWQKFIFISPTATATSYFNSHIGPMMEKQEASVLKLVDEVLSIAVAKGINTADDIVAKTMHRLKSMPYEATSSMHSDFKNGKPQTELESLTAYVIRQGQQLNVKTPTYDLMYEGLKNRAEGNEKA